MKKKLVSCIPNFSEGIDANIIQQIADAITSVEGVSLLDIDPGKSTNRTVYTFLGEPEHVVEAAFRGIKKAAELIDMRKHKGEHPRMGATDVCPIVPIQNITHEECVVFAEILAKRVGEELQIPVYLYEYAAKTPQRKSLADIRAGEYEGLSQKILLPEWKPDYGPAVFNEKSGATVIGVRDFLVAYNVNLNTKSVKRANSVAFDIREIGRFQLDENGNKVVDGKGNFVRIPGKLKHCRAIGWYVEEYGFAQVSVNLTNINITNLHDVFSACEESAFQRGLRVTGSEIVGLVPKSCLIDAAKYFLKRQKRSTGLSEEELIQFAIHSLGLNEIKPFDFRKKIIEYAIEEDRSANLVELTVKKLVQKVASESPAPGGGTVSALVGALGAALNAMVANLSPNKKGWDSQIDFFSPIAEFLQNQIQELMFWVDEDTRAYNQVMEAYSMPKSNDEEKLIRNQAIEKANQYATISPLTVCKILVSLLPTVESMLERGNPNSVTDAGVGLHCIYAGFQGAFLNVKINLPGVKDQEFVKRTNEELSELAQRMSSEYSRLSQMLLSKV